MVLSIDAIKRSLRRLCEELIVIIPLLLANRVVALLLLKPCLSFFGAHILPPQLELRVALDALVVAVVIRLACEAYKIVAPDAALTPWTYLAARLTRSLRHEERVHVSTLTGRCCRAAT